MKDALVGRRRRAAGITAALGLLAPLLAGFLAAPSASGSVCSLTGLGKSAQELTVGSDQVCELKFGDLPGGFNLNNVDDTWTVPDGVTSIDFILVGGGGGGGGGSHTKATGGAPSPAAGGGGGGGNVLIQGGFTVTPGERIAIRAGRAGDGGAGTTGTDGGDGVASSLSDDDTTITANGGKGGRGGNRSPDGGASGSGLQGGFHGAMTPDPGGGGGGVNTIGFDGVTPGGAGGAGGASEDVFQPGIAPLFNDPGPIGFFGGGGGGGAASDDTNANTVPGGSPGNNAGEGGEVKANGAAFPGQGPTSMAAGGGGGGGASSYSESRDGGAGRGGVVLIRFIMPAAPPNPNPPAPVPPAAPGSVTAVAGNASAVVSWSVPSTAGSFPVSTYRAVSQPGGRSCLVAAPATSCVVPGLTNGVTYTFTVQALSGAGWSVSSAPSNSVTPSAGPVPAPDPVPVPPLEPGQSSVTVDGVPLQVTVEPNDRTNGVDITGDDFAMNLQGLDAQGKPLNLGPDGVLILNTDRQVQTSGRGFLGTSEVDLYLDPPTLVSTGVARAAADQGTYVGTVITTREGSFSGTALLPEGIAVGDHVLQAVGLAKTGGTRAVSLGVRVESPITVPGPVRNIELVRVTSDGTAVLRWRVPSFDGGSPVIAYRVGHRLVSSDSYVRVRPNATSTRVRITGLTPGKAYWVRIKAGNIAGFGPGERYAERIRVPLG